MNKLIFKESSAAPTRVGNSWRAVLITPGKGSSGIYSEDVLKEYGPIAFPKGTHSYVDHPSEEGEIRSPKNLIGVLSEDAKYEKGVGIVANIEVMPHWKEFVEAVAPHTGLSIYAMGEGSENEDGDVVVESLVPNVQNSVDLVSYAGRPGSKLAEKLYESALAMEAGHLKKKVRRKKKMYEAEAGELAEKDLVRMDHGGEMQYGQVAYIMTDGVFPFEGDPLAITATEESPVALIRVWMQKDGKWEPTEMLMGHAIADLTKISALGDSEPESTDIAKEAMDDSNTREGYSEMDIKELSDQIAEMPNLIAAAVAEALAPAGEPEEKDEVGVEAVAEALVAANLPEVSRKAVYESLRNGGDLAAAIEGQKSFVESVKSHLKETSVSTEETFIVSTTEKAESLSGILNVKVGK